MNNFQNRRKLGISIRAERFVEAFASQSGLFRNTRHPLCARNHAERVRNQSRIPSSKTAFK